MKENGKTSTYEFLKLDFLYKDNKEQEWHNSINHFGQETAGDTDLS